MKRLLLLALLFLCTALFAQTREIEFVEYDLDNGMHVILHQDDSTPIVAVTVTYHVGSKNEDSERTGFAHFFEHLMFEGTKNIPRGEVDQMIQERGGTNNATTNFDRTYYYEILPSNQLEFGLWFESERMLQLTVDEIGVETQRKVVKEERSQRYDNQPYGSVLEETFVHAYKEHPYNWMPIGSAQYIDQATLEEFMEFYEHYYVPNNAILSIAGDIDIDDTKDWIEKYFGGIPSGEHEIVRPDVIEPPLNGEVRDTVYDNIQLPLVLHAYRIPERTSEDYYALDMLSTLLATGESSRLYKELVDNQKVAINMGAFQFALEDPGLYIAYGISNAGVSGDSLEYAMQQELNLVKEELIGEKEFQKLRNQVESQFVAGNSTVAGIAGSLADYYLFNGNTNLINTELERYLAVTREDIKRVANKYLNKDNRVVLYYLPKAAK